MKKLLALMTTAALVTAGTALAAAPDMEKVEYEGQGYVEVEFVQDVQYANPTVAVQDAAGAPLEAKLIETDDDDVLFHTDGLQPGATYSFTLTGISAEADGAPESIEGEFTTPETEIPFIQSVDVDLDDREIEIEFLGSVRFNSPAVTLTNAAGEPIDAQIIEADDDGLEVRVNGLVRGEVYTAEVSGVALPDGEPATVSREFTAIDD